MGETTGISWCRHTFNIVWGCEKVSPACKHCYAEAWDKRTGGAHWGPGSERRVFGPKHWAEPLKWNRAAENRGERARVFCSSMADVFEDHLTVAAERDRLWDLIASTPSLDWLLLTKRPENFIRFLPWRAGGVIPAWPNVWLGTTVENQEYADKRIPHLIAAPAAIRFLSVEPQLGPVEFSKWFFAGHHPSWDGHPDRAPIARIHWVIQGGESGSKARLFDLAWARDLRDQCAAAGVAYFCKQLGADPRDTRPGPPFRPGMPPSDFEVSVRLKDRAGADPTEWPVDLRVQEFPEVRT